MRFRPSLSAMTGRRLLRRGDDLTVKLWALGGPPLPVNPLTRDQTVYAGRL